MQQFIHKLEVGPWARHLRITMYLLVAIALFIIFNIRFYHNMNNEEVMDAAQVARNLSEGHGFTTLFIRPLSISIIKKHNEESYGVLPADSHTDYAELDGHHPDLANAPLYPCVLAVWLKVYPIGFDVLNGITSILPGSLKGRLPTWNNDPKNPFWEYNGHFWWWPADVFIVMLNEGLLLVVIVLSFFLARRLFDVDVAKWTVFFLFCSVFLWRFAVSGVPTMLMLIIFMGLAWCMVYVEQEVREPQRGPWALVGLPIAAGLLLAAGTMTRYSFACLVVPTILYLIWYGGPRRIVMCLIVAGTFVAACSPWIARNISVSGTPFGTAPYAIIDDPQMYPDHELERTMTPNLNINIPRLIGHKFLNNLHKIAETLPQLGRNWMMPFFMVGVLIEYRKEALNRLKNFIVVCLASLAVAQALGKTQLSDDVPDFNSENLLVLMTPLVLMFALSLVFSIVEQITFPRETLRALGHRFFRLLLLIPTVSGLVIKGSALAFPPYSPPTILVINGWMNEHELIMSDVPWAVAWYGQRQSIWLSLNCRDEFFAINDYIKPVRALYLTPETLDDHFLTQWVLAGEKDWGRFIVDSVVGKAVPEFFPLRAAPNGFMPSQLFLTDWARWKIGASTNSAAAAP